MFDAVVFDIGNVVLNYDLSGVINEIAKRNNCDPKESWKMLKTPEFQAALDEFECGRISPELFHKRLVDAFNLPMGFDEFRDRWNDIFTVNEGTAWIIGELFGNTRLYAASNTNKMHLEYIINRFPIIKSFDQIIASHSVGCRKPSIDFYKKVIEVVGRNFVFIDDLHENVDGALNAGISTIWFKNSSDLRRKLMGVGIL